MLNQQASNFEKWLWIEIIAFDNQESDFGVKEYLDEIGFIPDGLSLFTCSPDFVHTHEGMKEDREFPPDFCSYRGRPDRKRKERQIWTKYQLQGLIETLHNYKIQVYFAVFDLFLENKFHHEWADKHREVFSVRRNGKKLPSLNPLKRLKDGRYYEDFFIGKLMEVIKDYGFDGYHIADGYCHLRYPLSEIDYSDDLVSQFIKETGLRLPDNISGECDDHNTLIEKRADWIWRNQRLDWINFFVHRQERFFRKVVKALHSEGKQALFNTSWTRDPFEAIYRYGIDYRKVALSGVDRFVIEAVGAGTEIGGQGPRYPNFFYVILATVLLTKARAPDVKTIFLHGIGDITEGWDVLHHAPTFLEREIYTYPNLYHYHSNGELKRCFDGLLASLAQDIRPEEWAWLQDRWKQSFSLLPQSMRGITLVWSDKALENQLADFIKTRTATTHKILYELMARGAPIFSVVNIRDIEKVKGPLLVINSHLFPEEELKRIFTSKNSRIITIGRKTGWLPGADLQFEDVYPPHQLSGSIYGLKEKLEVEIVKDEEEKIPEDMAGLKEPITFTQELYFRKISASFLTGCVQAISSLTKAVKVLNAGVEIVGMESTMLGEGKLSANHPVKVLTIEKGEDELRLFIGNDSCLYANPEIDIGKDIDCLKVLTRFPGMPIIPEGSRLRVRIPGKGIVVLDVALK